MSKTKIICFANNKGGSGKSTTCANIGYCLSQEGKKILLLDADMQMNLTLSFFNEETVLEMARSEKNIYWAIKNQEDLISHVRKTPYDNLDLIPSNINLSGAEIELVGIDNKEFILKGITDKLRRKYDYIIMDVKMP